MRATLQADPWQFEYLNNGATLICDKVKKLPMYGDLRGIWASL